MTENEIGKVVVDSAIAVHNALGSGLYEIVFTHELKKHGLKVEREVPISSEYDGKKFDEGWNIKNINRELK